MIKYAFVNIYNVKGYLYPSRIYNTKKAAISDIKFPEYYIATTKIKWEEDNI